MFNGKAEEAFNFYKSILGGEFTDLKRYKDSPEPDYIPPVDQDKIMHISLHIGDKIILMACDSIEHMGKSVTSGNNIHLSLNLESEAKAARIFDGLSAGGKIEMPLEKTYWGAFFGMCKDKFGIHWMINYHYVNE
jgi:PhnB protein